MKWLKIVVALGVMIASTTPTWAQRRFVAGGPMSGTILPGTNGGMVIGGPMSGVVLPPSSGGTVAGEPSALPPIPGIGRGVIVGEPMVTTQVPLTNDKTAGKTPTNRPPLPLP